MLIYILIIIVITQTYSLNTTTGHNRIVRRKTDYKVNISMVDDDIEMVDKNKLNFSKTKKPHRTSQTRIVSKYKHNHTTTYPKIVSPTINVSRVDIVNTIYNDNSSIRSNYTAAKREGKTNEMYIVQIDANKTKPGEKLTNPTRIAREISTDRVWSIVQIWLVIYIILAIPLWCTIGRCCCCLVCKCFKAQETIREAKLYAMWNPPGVLRKSTGDIIYTPSDNEKEAYEQLEHLIRTL